MAADMPIKAPPPPPVAYYDWTGAYIGFNAGSTWSHVDQTFADPRCRGTGPGSANNFSTSPSNGIFGFHAGAQWQWGAWVLGAEAALSGCFNECLSTSGDVPPRPPTRSSQHKITNLFTVGPRLGYAWDRFMIFATGGYASADLKTSACSSVTGLCDQSDLVPETLTARRATPAGMPAAASTTWSTRARWSTCCSASNINITTSARKMRSASTRVAIPRPDGTKT